MVGRLLLFTVFATAVVAAGATSLRSEPAASLDANVAKARAAVKSMGGRLQEQLQAAIAAGGSVSAVGVCNTVAAAIAEEESKAAGLTIRRTALKVRNPANAPDALERKVLEDFLAKMQAGADPATLEHTVEVKDGERTMVRYFKAIPTAKEPCLTCHGDSVSGALKAEIARLYPDDQATGFKAGDLRGAFSVTIEEN